MPLRYGITRQSLVEPTFAFANTEGGMILSGPKDCRGSTKDVKILLHFLHSAGGVWDQLCHLLK